MRIKYLVPVILGLLLVTTNAYAAEQILTVSEKLDFLFIAVSAILVFIMQAGFALLESGMVRSKNAINVMMKNYVDLCAVMLVFWFFGYGLMWGSDHNGWIGFNDFFKTDFASPELMNLIFQLMFAATAATIVSGALAERINFGSYILISILMSAFLYPLIGGWIWNPNGWLSQLGFHDFAGATVVHSTGGWCALAALLILGPRLGRFSQDGSRRPIHGHNLTLVALSGFILWFGWFGFNMGSSGTVSGELPRVLFNTIIGGASGGIAGVLLMLLTRSPVLLTHTVVASISGLVAITAGADVMGIGFAALTGAVGGIVCILGIELLESLRVDDAVGAVACHAFAGSWGTIAAGMFIDGDLFNMPQTMIQIIGAAACFGWAFFGGLLVFGGVNAIIKLRVSSTTERRGLDYVEHYEIGYPEFQGRLTNPGKVS